MTFPVYLKNGEQVKINDHVYCSPSWDARDGTPYSIARVMQFLPPEDAPKDKADQYHYTRVRLAWYYRPSDVSDRPVADPRLLLAAIYSEVCDINQLRAKCHVVHRDKISDLSGWKKRPDRFYFNRLFDPYIKKEFEVIPSHDVRNLPDHIRDVLIQRYEFIVAEKEVIPELTDNIRLCAPCHEWCPSADSVLCDRCKKYFHMRCVKPPLSARPSKGYGWTCAPCSRRHEEEVDGHEITVPASASTGPKSKSNAPAARGRGRPRKDRSQAEKEENLPVKHFQMWPFRYFGQHTVAEDTVDPEDLIFPRTASRMGPKYQANVLQAPDPYSTAPDVDERGGDSTIEVLSNFNTLTEAELSEAEEVKKRLTRDPQLQHNVDWLTEVIKKLSEAASSGTMQNVKINFMRLEKWKKYETSYTDKPWTHEEEVAFEDAIMQHGAELRSVRDEVGTRSVFEVVRYYGLWKAMKLGEQTQMRKKSGPPPKPVRLMYRSATESQQGQRVGHSDDETSIITQPSKTPSCGACRTRESKVWWKAPKGLPSNILCDACGVNWRKYADLNVRPQRDDIMPTTKTRDKGEKREGTPLSRPNAKRLRTSVSVASTPPPSTNLPQHKCLECNRSGLPTKVVKCKKCQMKVHVAIAGAVVDPSSPEDWTCELCENEETQEASTNSDCLLCPRSEGRRPPVSIHPKPDSLLRVMKPTEGQGWAHVICAVFIPELTFTDASRLRLVEGLNVIQKHRWTSKCSLCQEPEGAVIRCTDCVKEFHVSCAYRRGHRFGFEMQPVKSSRRDTTITTTFKGESGLMNAVIFCKEHDRSKRMIYNMCEMNEAGESALQVYCQAYKQAPVSQAHGLLRKARRLDPILNLRSGDTSHVHGNAYTQPSPSPSNSGGASASNGYTSADPECYRCHSQFSPFFYKVTDTPLATNGHSEGGKEAWMCHRCHFEINENNSKMMGVSSS